MPHRNKPKFFRGWAIIIIVLVGFLAINATQSYRALSELVENENDANLTKSVLRTIKDLYSSVQEAELGLRGFFLTGAESYLGPYYFALSTIDENLIEMRNYDFQIPEQIDNTKRLELVILERLQEAGSHILQKQADPDSYRISSEKMRQSYDSMAELGEVIRTMEELEYDLLERQSERAHRSRQNLLYTIVIANSVGLLLIILVAYLIRKALKTQLLEAEHLEMLVHQRTEELEHYSNELQRSNRELQDFAFVASHDLQEPLRKIRAFGDRLKSVYAGKLGDGEDYIDRMQSAASRMSRLIEDLLEFSRVSTRAKPFGPVDLNQVMNVVLDNLEIKIQERNAQVTATKLPIIDADESQMHQLFQNLIGNAIKFTQPDIQPQISIECQVYETVKLGELENIVYEIKVKDNGIGFDEKYIEKIFTPFQRLHGRDKYEGTGIGLAICRRIVERHQGTIEVDSIPGEGSTFTLYLNSRTKDQLVGTEISPFTEGTPNG